MRALKVAVIVMGVLIVAGTVALMIGVARRSSGFAGSPANVSALLDEPEGTRIAGLVAVRDRFGLLLQGGGADRVVLIDAGTGAVAGRIALVR